MKILLTGASGYIGKRLLPVLVADGHHVVCCVRDENRFFVPESLKPHITVLEMDLQDAASLTKMPADIDAAYYLVHSMSSSDNYAELEQRCAVNFRNALAQTQAKQVIYLSGIINESTLSKHLLSRKNVEMELGKGQYHLTTLRAGIIVGSGSASFEIMRDLVEKLPVMIAPKWLKTKCQPIGIADVLQFLRKVLLNPQTYDKSFDIGGPDVLSYKEMLLIFAEVRGLKRYIFTVPVMTPKLSSYWLYFVTATSFKLATALVASMNVEIICRDNSLSQLLGIKPIDYRESLRRAFRKIESDEVISSWKDASISSEFKVKISDFIEVPTYGCFKDIRTAPLENREATLQKIWSIGGETGWYYGNWLWQIRGALDKLFGGVGLRRGRTSPKTLHAGDALDFWRVLYADREEGRLLLYAEMKLPGEAWLEFKIEGNRLIQTATFRPLGVFGRLYWYLVLPFHGLIFQGLLNKLSASQ
jgi:uncharacterized protein YbjT (DUF2867 family)